MVYSNKVILDENITVQSITPFGLVQLVDSKFNIPLGSNEKITYGRIYVKVTVPPHLSEGVVTILFNNNLIGNLDFGGFDFSGTSKDIQIDVTDKINPASNELIVKLDSLSDNLQWTVYADIYYELNGPVPTTQPTVGNPPSSSQSSNTPLSSGWEKAKPYIIGGMVLAGIGLVAYALVGTKSGRGMTINLINRARRKS